MMELEIKTKLKLTVNGTKEYNHNNTMKIMMKITRLINKIMIIKKKMKILNNTTVNAYQFLKSKIIHLSVKQLS